MSLKVDKVQLEIIMKSDTARNEINKLELDAKSLKKEMTKLKNSPEELAVASAKYDVVTARIRELQKSIGLAGMNMRELQQRSKELSLQLRNIDPRSAKFNEYSTELKQVNTRMKELRGTAQATQSGLSNLAGGFNKYFAVATTAIATITGMSFAFRKLAEDVAHMDDVYSDVMKTTNLSKEQVLELNESFKEMDTRTSRESLNKLARDAGKLGIEGSKNILDFVDAGNQINVALGEDLGEDAIKNIGKMVGVFEKSTTELQGIGLKEQMLAVGSAINSLGAASSADESYLVAFAGRLGGISKQAGISMDAILGFGSALDQDMQQVEMSATALQNFITKIMADPAKFAKLAGLEVKGFTTLLKQDANVAIKQVLRAMNEKGGFQALIPIFQEMGLDGARAVGVLSAMAGSIDKVDEAQKLANISMTEGSSVSKEYNIKNENLAAKLEKAKKAFQETALELGASLSPALLNSVHGTTYLIKGLVELPKWLKENAGKLTALILVIIAYTIATNAAIIADKAKLFWNNQLIASFKRLWIVISTNPYAAVAAVTAVLVGTFIDYIQKVKEAINLQSEHKKIQDRAINQTQEEEITLKSLKKILNDNTKSYIERKNALDEIKKIVPNYHASLTAEGTLINNNSDALDTYIQKLKLSAQQQFATTNLAGATEEQRKFVEDNKDALLEIAKMRMKAVDLINSGKYNNMDDAGSAAGIGAGYKGIIVQLDKINEKIKIYNTLVNQYTSDLSKINAKNLPNTPSSPTTTDEDPNKKSYEKALKTKEDAYKKVQLDLMEQLRKGQKTEEQYNTKALEAQLSFLEDKLILQRKFKQDTIDTQIEISTQQSKIQADADAAAIKVIEDNQKAGLIPNSDKI